VLAAVVLEEALAQIVPDRVHELLLVYFAPSPGLHPPFRAEEGGELFHGSFQGGHHLIVCGLHLPARPEVIEVVLFGFRVPSGQPRAQVPPHELRQERCRQPEEERRNVVVDRVVGQV